MEKKRDYCNNCGNFGHTYSNCRHPILSYGVILYNYDKDGLASFYGKELHNVKTINNDLNKVTELLGRHKTLPLPSTVKITNLENGISLISKFLLSV